MVEGLSAVAYRRLSKLISGSSWVEGGRLPPEEELARAIGVSRPILRRALSLLREEGRISSRRGSGNYVQPADRDAIGVFAALPVRDIRDLECCMSFRRVIEVAIAGEAAERADADLLTSMEIANRCVASVPPDGSLFEADFAFHCALARGSRNPYLLATIEALRDQVRTAFELGRRMRDLPPNEPSGRVTDEHERILDAIRRGDAPAARAAMDAHIGGTIRRFFGSSS